ncbi:hypothetical protein LEP1GSC043_1881 [Leptospira weilii str. Ecochallenge]|uniref:Uncharacterized protein n=1 Tax=Leptospira weilii str. Ecochallenge TaxID=1049986 RepID=N1U486_9LEPT|nr:hypothetical protein LEP1GSC043_1881 [Leptospira weilii str. Ecochallenge]
MRFLASDRNPNLGYFQSVIKGGLGRDISRLRFLLRKDTNRKTKNVVLFKTPAIVFA